MSDLERMGGVPRPPLARRTHSEVPAGTPDEAPEEKRPRTSEDLRPAPRFWGRDGTAVASSSEDEDDDEEGSGSESDDDDDDDDDVGDLAEDDGEDEGEDPLALFGHR